MLNRIKALIAVAVIGAGLLLTGCSPPSTVVSQNISNDADNFKVDRRIVVINLIVNKPVLEVEGKCSITNATEKKMLEIVCKVGADAYTKTYAGYTDGANMVFTIEQMTNSKVDSYHYKLNFFPTELIPTIVTG